MIVLLKIIPFFHHFHPGLFQETPFAEIVGQAYEIWNYGLNSIFLIMDIKTI